MYGENTLCRLCNTEDETVEHVVNNCKELERTRQIDNIFTTECGELKEMAVRCIAFDDKLGNLSHYISRMVKLKGSAVMGDLTNFISREMTHLESFARLAKPVNQPE